MGSHEVVVGTPRRSRRDWASRSEAVLLELPASGLWMTRLSPSTYIRGRVDVCLSP